MPTHVGHVELLVNGRCVGYATYDFDEARLWSEVRLRKPPASKQRAGDCGHPNPVAAWAYLLAVVAEWHWPIRFCADCRTILDGDELVPPHGVTPEEVAAWDYWKKRWLKKGKPRRPAPPPDVVWPDAA